MMEVLFLVIVVVENYILNFLNHLLTYIFFLFTERNTSQK